MKIQELEIKDIGGIPYLKLGILNSQMNIICGENGIGKTGIINAIAFAFSDNGRNSIKRRAGSQDGLISFEYLDNDGCKKEYTSLIDVFLPEFYAYHSPQRNRVIGEKIPSHNAIYLKVNRVFEYKYEDAIRRDPLYDLYGVSVLEGLFPEDIKSWIITRDLFDGKEYLHEYQKYNLDLAKRLINSLYSDYFFSKIDTDHEIIISTPAGNIYFEYLSSGFKSSFFILLGILMEIEYKHGKNYIRADEYDGVILIDEIELHLHPEWQGKILRILKQEFPKAQFFITTHSPHIIQSAEYSEIIALDKRDAPDAEVPFEVYKRDLPESAEYGFQGWTIEEILTDVMGMKTTSGKAYDEQMEKFSKALDNEDRKSAEEAFKELAKMLHPNSHMRKMLQLQMVGLR